MFPENLLEDSFIDIFYFKLSIGLFLSIIFLVLLYSNKEVLIVRNRTVTLFSSFFFLRILPFFIIYIVFNFDARSDVEMFYESALGAKRLGFVYRDFDSAYSPLFAYITALPLFLWNSPKAIILFMILVECVIVWFTINFYKSKNALKLGILYLLLPGSFVFSILGGQEDIWMWLFVLLGIYFSKIEEKPFYLGLALGFGLLITKALLVLYIPAILVFSKKPLHIFYGLLLIGIPSLGFLYLHSELSFLSPIQQANDPRTPNIWSIIHPLSDGLIPIGPKILNWIGLLSIQSLGIYFAVKLKNRIPISEFLLYNFLIISIWLMIIQQSSLANYAYVYLLPLIFFLKLEKSKKTMIILLLFNILIIVQPALWWGLKMPVFHSLLEINLPLEKLEYSLEVMILALLFWLFLLVINRLKENISKN